jgi:hypothetical protein
MMNYTELLCTALHYNTLQYITLRYTELHYTTVHYNTLFYTELHYVCLDDAPSQLIIDTPPSLSLLHGETVRNSYRRHRHKVPLILIARQSASPLLTFSRETASNQHSNAAFTLSYCPQVWGMSDQRPVRSSLTLWGTILASRVWCC